MTRAVTNSNPERPPPCTYRSWLGLQMDLWDPSCPGDTSAMATEVGDPDLIRVTADVRLRRFDPQRATADVLDALLPCYRDPETVRLVDGPNAEPYDLDKLKAMYRYMNEHGELYLVERLTRDHRWIPIGDAGLQAQATPIVLAPYHRGQGIGRAVLTALIERARGLGWQSVEVSEIYDYNVASQRSYESLGFVAVADTELGRRYSRPLT